MKLKITLSVACLFAVLSTYAQVDTTAPVEEPPTDMAIPEPPSIMEDDYYELTAPAAETVEDYDYNDYVRINKFKHNKKIKPEEKPDKKASYSMGTGELLRNIRQELVVPYQYGSITDDNFVLIQFTVGKDSSLYNPEILFSPGAEYSINATTVIEGLQYSFSPAMKNGKPVDSIITVPIRFERQKRNDYNDWEYRH